MLPLDVAVPPRGWIITLEMDICPEAVGVCPEWWLQGREHSPWWRGLDVQPGGLGIGQARWILAVEG